MSKIMESAATKLRREGRVDLLSSLLEARFGKLPPAVVARIAGASEEDARRWALCLLDGGGLEDIFAADPQRP
ncbi:MAG: hypothetical protein U1E73_06135 [Planctomycetota bacterium]